MFRDEWLTLNGVWEFAESNEATQPGKFPDKIVVPFCRESELSGLGRKGLVKNVWYRRQFEVPKGWKSPRVRFHVGACDYLTTVFVNGKEVGQHQGGSASFAFDITKYLTPGSNTVMIHAFDDTASGLQPTGKQSHREESWGIMYTRTTGIWQSVWLEGVGATYLKNLMVDPEPDHDQFRFRAEIDGETAGTKVRVTVRDKSQTVAAETIGDWRNGVVTVKLKKPTLWSVKNPHLYDVTVQVLRDGKVVDEVASQAGLRKISIRGRQVLLNGEPVFQRLVLDQGFYPDGIWTAPSDAALKGDIELAQAAGFNGARLHQKVFEPRFLYWADRMGYLCWGESPNYGMNHANRGVDLPFLDEWNSIVLRDRNHPSVIGWCPFNETDSGAIPLQNATVRLTRQLDPSRPVIETSGYTHGLADAEIRDAHDYDQNPVSFFARWNPESSPLPARYHSRDWTWDIPFMVSEYGGIGWDTALGWGYGENPKTLEEFYTRLDGLTGALLANPRMFGYVYTQLTDVEQERNGIYAYDRKPKFDMAKIRAIFGAEAAFEKGGKQAVRVEPKWKVLVGSARDKDAQPWRMTETRPPTSWNQVSFNEVGWKTAAGAFGKKDGFEKDVKTPWTTSDIWLRQEFTVDSVDFKRAMLALHYDNTTNIYLNRVLIWGSNQGAWNDGYAPFDVTERVRLALKPGRNVLAVHCHQETGGQFIDLALLME